MIEELNFPITDRNRKAVHRQRGSKRPWGVELCGGYLGDNPQPETADWDGVTIGKFNPEFRFIGIVITRATEKYPSERNVQDRNLQGPGIELGAEASESSILTN